MKKHEELIRYPRPNELSGIASRGEKDLKLQQCETTLPYASPIRRSYFRTGSSKNDDQDTKRTIIKPSLA